MDNYGEDGVTAKKRVLPLWVVLNFRDTEMEAWTCVLENQKLQDAVYIVGHQVRFHRHNAGPWEKI